MDDVKQLMQRHYLKYASYVILDRAIPNVVDGLKPVQRRILYTLWMMHNEKLHKVANVVGQTMAYHPHGDAPIYEALVNLANKNYLLDRQGNFGNIFTGDPSAAARYIEARLTLLALETLFNPDLTDMLPSYDGRHKEPAVLPAKIPLILMLGASGIAVGMSTYILPHNFSELLEAEIAILEGRDYTLLPDFPTAGIMDASLYEDGKGKVKLRAYIEVKDPKTLVIREICYGTTTESLIRSIDEAAKKGKIKIEAIDDYTAENVEIEIKLPRGQYAHEILDALYAYTECQVTLNSQIVVIKDNLPWEPTVNEILQFHVTSLQDYLRRELEIERERLLEKIFKKTLEQIFIENRLYKKIENIKSYDEIHETVGNSLVPFHKQLSRIPTHDDREHLLSIPIRRISRFDLDKNKDEIATLENDLGRIEKHLKNIKKFTINYLKKLVDKYQGQFARKTRIESIEQIDIRAIATKTLRVGFDPESGFVGTKVNGTFSFECTNFDKLLLMFKDGSYTVMNIPEKQYVQRGQKVVYVGIADKKTIFSAIYKTSTQLVYAKRFIVEKFILDKFYRFLEEGVDLEFLSSAARPRVELKFIPKIKQKSASMVYDLTEVLVKGVSAKGVRLSPREVKKILLLKE
ncbi:DNA topoisomerase 4 subunit A [Chlamydiales bacterium STE3]|nr:DNA topoisomerase 4 subunit A [Chlamydiales bacterium STE3]